MNKFEKKDRHNYLMNCIKKWELEDSNCKDEKKHEDLINKITYAADEIDKIRIELGVNTSTIITEEEIKI